jgi:hypothetical protein
MMVMPRGYLAEFQYLELEQFNLGYQREEVYLRSLLCKRFRRIYPGGVSVTVSSRLFDMTYMLVKSLAACHTLPDRI